MAKRRKVRPSWLMFLITRASARSAAPAAGGPAAGDGLLLESPADSFLILETGDYLLLE